MGEIAGTKLEHEIAECIGKLHIEAIRLKILADERLDTIVRLEETQGKLLSQLADATPKEDHPVGVKRAWEFGLPTVDEAVRNLQENMKNIQNKDLY